MSWTVRSFNPASRTDVHSVCEYDTEAAAYDDYLDRSVSIREAGGGAELLNEQGEKMASIMRPLGGKP